MSLNDKISLAHHLNANYGLLLLQDEEIKALILELDKRIEDTWRGMASTGVLSECTDCALSGGGSCCGSGMEKRYNEILLLVNLLLGRSLSQEVYDLNSCSFLGENGCTLRAREVICVNYLCQRIYKGVGHEKLIHLQKIAGEELKTLFALEEGIKKKINQMKGLHYVTKYETCRTY